MKDKIKELLKKKYSKKEMPIMFGGGMVGANAGMAGGSNGGGNWMQTAQTVGNIAGGINNALPEDEIALKQEGNSLNVDDTTMQKTIEGAAQSIPIANMFYQIGEVGASLGDKVLPGLGEGLFTPHKGMMRAFETGKAQYAIPIVGNILAGMDAKKEAEEKERKEYIQNNQASNPFGTTPMRKLGGAVDNKLKEYDAPSHEQGGQLIDGDLEETNNPEEAVAEIEKKETGYKNFIFSDTLSLPNGKTFAEKSKKIEKKYKDVSIRSNQKAKEIELKMLAQKNEKAKQEVEDNMKTKTIKDLVKSKMGGKVKEYPNGGQVKDNTILTEDQILDLPYTYYNNPMYTGLDTGLPQPVLDKVIDNQIADKSISSSYPDKTQKEKTLDIKMTPTKDKLTIDPMKVKVSNVDETTLPNQDQYILGDPDDISSPVEKKGMHYLTPAMIGKGTELLGKAGILAGGYDKVKQEYNPYADKIKTLLGQRRGVNQQALLNEINLQRDAALANNKNTRSLNVKRALDSNVFNNTARQAMLAKLQEKMTNNQLLGEDTAREVAGLSGLGESDRQSERIAKDLTARNKGQFQTNLGTFYGDIGRAGAFGTKYLVNDMQMKEGLQLLGNKYEDFGINKEAYKRLANGTFTDEDFRIYKKAVENVNK